MVQRELAAGLSEYRSATISWKTAQSDAERLLDELGAHQLYSRVVDRVGALAQLHASAQARSTLRRTQLVASLAVLVAIALGLPAIVDTLGLLGLVASAQSTGVPTQRAPGLAFVVFGLLVAVSLGLAVWSVRRWPRLRARRTKYRSVGIQWPGREFVVTVKPGEFRGGVKLARSSGQRKELGESL